MSDYKPMGTPEWKKQERDYLVTHIDWEIQHIKRLKDMIPQDENKAEFEAMIEREEAILDKYRQDLKLLRDGGDEYEQRYKKT